MQLKKIIKVKQKSFKLRLRRPKASEIIKLSLISIGKLFKNLIILVTVALVVMGAIAAVGYLFNKFVYYPKAHVEKAKNLIFRGDFSGAEEIFDILIRHYKREKIYLEFAKAYLKVGAHQHAVYKITSVLSKKPTHIGALSLLAQYYYTIGQLNDAENLIKSILKRNPRLLDLHLLWAKILYETKRYEGAQDRLRYALAIDRKCIEAHQLLQKIRYYIYKKDEDALKIHYFTFQKINKVVINPDIIQEIAAKRINTQPLLAYKLLERIIRYSKPKDETYLLFARALYKLNNLSYAKRTILEKFPKTKEIEPLKLLCKIYYKEGDIRGAYNLARQMENLTKKDVDVYNILGDLALDLGEFDTAARAYESAIELGRVDVPLRYNLACAYFHIGNYKGAIQQWQTIPYNTTTRYNIATAYICLGELNEAQNLSNQLIQECKKLLSSGKLTGEIKYQEYHKLSRIYNNLGVIEQLRNNHETAAKFYMKAIHISYLSHIKNTQALLNFKNYTKAKSINVREAVCGIYEGSYTAIWGRA